MGTGSILTVKSTVPPHIETCVKQVWMVGRWLRANTLAHTSDMDYVDEDEAGSLKYEVN